MGKFASRSVKLGLLVAGGLFLFAVAIFYLGSQQALFSSTVTVKSYFDDVRGLMEGNKVQYSGITVGHVAHIEIINDTTILVEMAVNNVRINALTIIIGLLLGNLIWGIAGMLIIIPYIAILKIIMRNIESLQPFAYLLSSKGLEKHQIHYGRYFMNVKEKLKKLWSAK